MEIIEKIISLSKKQKNVLAIIQYGSQVTGKTHAFSDYDICLVMPDATKQQKTKLLLNAAALSDNIDIKIFEELPTMLKGEVMKSGQHIYVKDKDRLAEYLWYQRKIYDDFLYQYKLAHVSINERIKKWKQKKG